MTSTPEQIEAARVARHAARDELAARLPAPRVWADTDTVNLTTQVTSYSAADAASSSWRIMFSGTRLSEITITNLPLDKALRIAEILAE